MLDKKDRIEATLSLRPLRASDEAAIQSLASEKRVAHFTAHIPHPYPDGAAKAFIEKALQSDTRGESRTYAIADVESDDLIGIASIEKQCSGELQFGYWLGVPYWGKGFATEAVSKLCAAAAEWDATAAFSALVDPENAASIRVLEKNGFMRNGNAPCSSVAQGISIDAYRYTREAGQ